MSQFSASLTSIPCQNKIQLEASINVQCYVLSTTRFCVVALKRNTAMTLVVRGATVVSLPVSLRAVLVDTCVSVIHLLNMSSGI